MKKTIVIQGAELCNEGRRFTGSLVVEDTRISRIYEGTDVPMLEGAEVVDGRGMLLLPGVIDDHVHMRDPGLTRKATMDTESAAAAAGGVTTVMDMPNVVPQTVTLERVEEKLAYAASHCHVNHAFFLGATNDNIQEIRNADPRRIPGIKLFMGSSTGNMLVDKREQLERIFRESPMLVMAHCEDTARITTRMKELELRYGTDDPDVVHHAEIRDSECCIMSSRLAVEMALAAGTRLHIAHLTTAAETEMVRQLPSSLITAEACVAHLLYTDADYQRLGTRIKCNPSVKSEADRAALRRGVADGTISIVATDHAPHLLSEKAGGCRKAMSGMPMVQFSLLSMLEMASEGLFSIERIVEVMCHNPARLFQIDRRGFLREGYQADLVLVKPCEGHKVDKSEVLSLCGWSPREGDTLHWRVERTWVNGQQVWDGQHVDRRIMGQALVFDR